MTAILVLAVCARAQQDAPPSGEVNPDAPRPMRLKLADAPLVEKQTLTSLLKSESWPRRAIAATRLERYDDQDARTILTNLLNDPQWQVRCFAIRSLGRMRIPIDPTWIASEDNPRVLRTLLRHRYRVDADRIRRGVEALAKSNDLNDKLMAAELGAASGDAQLEKLANETARTIILRMNRTDAGLSPRLAAITNVENPHRAHLWQQWLMKKGRSFETIGVFAVDDTTNPVAPGELSQLEPETFSDLEQYIKQLGDRDIDLAIVIDCTASMSGELSQAQGEIDGMMLFVGDVVRSLRVGIVAYRDHKDKFTTKGWEFTSDIQEASRNLWTLSADGGGDGPELVYEALKSAHSDLSWIREHDLILVLIGDAPPHVGFGQWCVDMTKRAHEDVKLTTHVIEADGRDDQQVKHFAEIAAAGGGQYVPLGENDSLVVEVTGLTLGKRFKDEMGAFFRTYLDLCR